MWHFVQIVCVNFVNWLRQIRMTQFPVKSYWTNRAPAIQRLSWAAPVLLPYSCNRPSFYPNSIYICIHYIPLANRTGRTASPTITLSIHLTLVQIYSFWKHLRGAFPILGLSFQFPYTRNVFWFSFRHSFGAVALFTWLCYPLLDFLLSNT